MVDNQTETMNEVTVIITANGEGSRMKGISPLPKHLLWYGGKRIVDHIRDAFPGLPVKVLARFDTPGHDVIRCGPTRTRKETLEIIRGVKNVLVCDCDIIPAFYWHRMPVVSTGFDTDAIWFFESDCEKYGGLEIDDESRLVAAKERGQGHKYRASGLYFLKDVGATLDRMEDHNGLAAAMIGARCIPEDTFIRLGDPEDYTNAVLER